MTLPAVLVTGASRRLGAEIARAFGAGWHVIVHHHTHAEDARALAAALPSAETVAFDLADRDEVAAAVAGLAARRPRWRALVLNAAGFEPDWPMAPDWLLQDRMLAANFAGNVALANAFLAATSAGAERRIVALLDQKLFNMNPDFFSYTVSKAALHTWVGMLAMASPDPRLRIHGLAPGLIQPSHDQTADEFEATRVMNLLRRGTALAEVADAARWLVEGPLASGEVLCVDSGQHLVHQPRDVMYQIREHAQ